MRPFSVAWALAVAAALALPASPRAQGTEADTARALPPARRIAFTSHSDTLGRVVPIPGLEVSTARGGERMPIARKIGRAHV